MQLTKEQWVKLLTGLSEIAFALEQQNANTKSASTAREASELFQEIITELDKK